MRSITVEPLDCTFGAVVHGVDLAEFDGGSFDAVHDAWVEHGLVILNGEQLAPDRQDEVAHRFGELEFTATPLTNIRRGGTLRDPGYELASRCRRTRAGTTTARPCPSRPRVRCSAPRSCRPAVERPASPT